MTKTFLINKLTISSFWMGLLVSCNTSKSLSDENVASIACDNATCPPGTFIDLEALSYEGCEESANGSVIIDTESGSISAKCFNNSTCKYVCKPPRPCCGLEEWTLESYSCHTPCCDDGNPPPCESACGNRVCEFGEDRSSCPQDCESECTPGQEVCDGLDRKICTPSENWEIRECPSNSSCRELSYNSTECKENNSCTCTGISECCDGCFVKNEFQECNDGNFCTENTICQSNGVCGNGREKNCDYILTDSQCQNAICDNNQRRCYIESINDGEACDNQNPNDGQDRCTNGICVGESCICGEINDCCDGCFPKNEDGGCTNGNFCVINEHCQSNGLCSGGNPRDCSDSITNNECQIEHCDENLDRCTAAPARDSESCDDGQWCTVNDRCDNGLCVSGEDRDCSGIVTDAICQLPYCDENAEHCRIDGMNDGVFCEENRICDAGLCTFRWIVNDNNVTINDRVTNREWTVDTSEHIQDWNDAIRYCDQLNLGGHSDWRLPRIQELRSLIDGCPNQEERGACGVTDPDCLGVGCDTLCEHCGGSPTGCYWHPAVWHGDCTAYWTISTFEGNPNQIWYIQFQAASMSTVGIPLGTGNNVRARCVRP